MIEKLKEIRDLRNEKRIRLYRSAFTYEERSLVDELLKDVIALDRVISILNGEIRESEKICDNPKWLKDTLKESGETNCPDCGKLL